MKLKQIGKSFYEYGVLRNGMRRKRKSAVYQCECGNTVIVRCDAIKSTKSCGCATSDLMSKSAKLRKPNRLTHGKFGTKIYKVWSSMKERCYNVNHHAYINYGARGITVCDKWLQFEGFYEDMGDPPKGLTLDRINNNGNYELSNCRWTTQKQQNRNRRSNVILTIDGESKIITDWAKECNINRSTIRNRLKKGWSHKEAVFGKQHDE